MTLEEKIKEYLKSIPYGQQVSKSAKDIAEIAEKEINDEKCDKFRELAIKIWIDENSKLEKENADLKTKLDKVKYLDRDSINSIILELIDGWDSTNKKTKECAIKRWNKKEKAINAILSLAIPVIDKDRIIGSIKKFVTFNADMPLRKEGMSIYEMIANEILNNKE